jgi:hypothetical protein
MGLFSKRSKTNKESFEINWSLPEDLTCDLKEKEYDINTSVKAFLKKRKIDSDKIDKIMANKNPLNEAIKLYNKPNLRSYDLYCDESIRIMNLLILSFIENTKAQIIFEYTVTYITYKIAQFYDWDIRTRKSDETFMRTKMLKYMQSNNYEEMMKYFSKDVFSCFAYTQKMTKRTVKEAVDIGLEYLELNSQHINSALGSFYLTFGKNNVEGLIYKIIEATYKYHNFSVGTVLKKAKNN